MLDRRVLRGRGLVNRRTAGGLAIAFALTGGCVHPHIEPRPGGAVIKSTRTGWYTKKVVTKTPPETLLAEDGTICRVAPDRYAHTDVGTLVYCDWQ